MRSNKEEEGGRRGMGEGHVERARSAREMEMLGPPAQCSCVPRLVVSAVWRYRCINAWAAPSRVVAGARRGASMEDAPLSVENKQAPGTIITAPRRIGPDCRER